MSSIDECIELFDVNLEVEGEIISMQLSAKEIEEISNDANKYVKKFQDGKRNKCMKEKQENEILDRDQTRPSGSGGKKWGLNDTRLLIALRLLKEKEFCNPQCKKNKLWDSISSDMKKKQYQYSGQDCHAKYRNLLQTYKTNKDKRLKGTGESKITWEFFNQFDEVLGYKNSTTPPDNLLSTSMETLESDVEMAEDKEQATQKKQATQEKRATQEKENKASVGKKEKRLSVSHYLFEKNQSRKVREEQDERRWQEKKTLKEKEIAAINNLSDAIRTDIRKKRAHSDSE